VREIHVPLVGWHVGALGHVAHIAEIALVDHLAIIGLGDAVHLHGFGLIHQVKKRGEGVAEADTATTAVADVENPLQFLVEGILVVKIRIFPFDGVTRRSLKTAFSITHVAVPFNYY